MRSLLFAADTDTLCVCFSATHRAQKILQNVQRAPGRIPKGQFIVLEKIGEGAFGNVHRGALYQDGVNTLVAVKELKVRVQFVACPRDRTGGGDGFLSHPDGVRADRFLRTVGSRCSRCLRGVS